MDASGKANDHVVEEASYRMRAWFAITYVNSKNHTQKKIPYCFGYSYLF